MDDCDCGICPFCLEQLNEWAEIRSYDEMLGVDELD
jgi:hypothetical protein